MRQVIAAVKSAGGRDVGTQSVSLSQVFTNNGEPSGFAASNIVIVTIDLDKAGALIDAAVEAGANNVNGPTMSVADQSSLYRQALKAADGRRAPERRDARRRRGPLARQGHDGRRERRHRSRADVREGGRLRRGTPIEAGTQETTASVTVTFALG